jgi:NAD(P)-dependent dehydrogenase (short-subunit alcohol dehydrogenase family)
MRAQGGGVIVNVASGDAFMGLEELAAYSAAKGGLVSVGRVIALEAARYGIRLNTVVPGRTDTAGVRAAGGPIPETSDGLPANERWMRPEEIAEVIVWCSSHDAHMVNGALLRVDGGWQML